MRILATALLALALAVPASADAVTLNTIGHFAQPTFLTSAPEDPDTPLRHRAAAG